MSFARYSQWSEELVAIQSELEQVSSSPSLEEHSTHVVESRSLYQTSCAV